ncbi:two-component SAPR family response regulator [Pedobacter sp. UYP30]|uniref:LytR/AlgR family response regulator transcription factor n=1 Tax=Pedobacter sp. UYP30 TaxID=1756400 RepID=UPI0033957945
MRENHNNALYKCAIVDDDLQFMFLLSTYVKQVSKLQLAGTYLDPQVAMDSISEEDNIDFLFLDIRMGNISGVDVAAYLRDKVKFIVFVSGSSEYALDALQVGGDQYLLKPIPFSTFLTTINGLLARQRTSKQLNSITSG